MGFGGLLVDELGVEAGNPQRGVLVFQDLFDGLLHEKLELGFRLNRG